MRFLDMFGGIGGFRMEDFPMSEKMEVLRAELAKLREMIEANQRKLNEIMLRLLN